jgi:hypothetical protein
VAGQWFSLGTPVSSTNNTDRHDIAEILLKVALNTINLHPFPYKPPLKSLLVYQLKGNLAGIFIGIVFLCQSVIKMYTYHKKLFKIGPYGKIFV